MAHRPRLPDPLHEKAVQVQQEKDLPSLGEALRHMAQSGIEYDV